MRVLHGIKSFFQFVADPDTFCLVRLALRSFFNSFRGEELMFKVKKPVR